MRYLLTFLTLTAWALWFGGTIALFAFVTFLFRTHHDIAGEANSAMFVLFGWAQLIPAGAAVLSAGLLLTFYSQRNMVMLLACLVLSFVLALTSGLGIIPRMEALREQGLSKTDQFKKMHVQSMVLMLSQSVLLLGCGMILAKETEPAGAATTVSI